ncbi:SGNH/GDSL hydrolase family protein, partial [Crocinitomicaceae bacterium]|nr:SGNH/GDSL hydrolase family protein [Crocinitomicaceae bacterium]
SIPDYGVTPFGSNNSETIATEIDAYNGYAKSRCDIFNIPFINITQISRELGDSEGALASDNLHPSSLQYVDWVEEIAPAVKELLQ